VIPSILSLCTQDFFFSFVEVYPNPTVSFRFVEALAFFPRLSSLSFYSPSFLEIFFPFVRGPVPFFSPRSSPALRFVRRRAVSIEDPPPKKVHLVQRLSGSQFRFHQRNLFFSQGVFFPRVERFNLFLDRDNFPLICIRKSWDRCELCGLFFLCTSHIFLL